jgi:hypothetical protein
MRYLATGLLALLVSAPATAEPIPPSVLENVRAACMRDHGHKPGGPVYCTCIAMETGRNVSLQKLASIEGEIKGGKHPTQIPEMVRIERTCQRAS